MTTGEGSQIQFNLMIKFTDGEEKLFVNSSFNAVRHL